MRPRNGPPLAVSTMRATSDGRPERRHCHTAECSESTGTISPAARRARLGDDGPGRDQAFLVGQRQPLPRLQGTEGRREPGETHDGVEHHVGIRQGGELGEDLGPVGARADTIGRNTELGRLRCEQVRAAARGERHDAVLVAMTSDRTSSACVPIDPVDPRMATPRVMPRG